MNKVFRVIWNHATQTWTAVSELGRAKGKTKSSKLSKLSAAAMAVSSVVTIGQAQAAVEMQSGTNTFIAIPNAETTANANPKNTVYGVIIGSGAKLDGNGASQSSLIAIGNNAKAGKDGVQSTGSIAIGQDSESSGLNAVALAKSAKAHGLQTTALGAFTNATGTGATSLGTLAMSGERATAVGIRSCATGVSAVAVGDFSNASGRVGVAQGQNASSITAGSVALGAAARAGKDADSANTDKGGSVAVGSGSWATGNRAIAIGGIQGTEKALANPTGRNKYDNNPITPDEENYPIENTQAFADESIAIGSGAQTAQYRSIVMGHNSRIDRFSTINITRSVHDDVNSGWTTETNTIKEQDNPTLGSTVAIGSNSLVHSSTNSIAIGNYTRLGSAHSSIAIGDGAQVNAITGHLDSKNVYGAVAIGRGAISNARESVAIGTQANNPNGAVRSVSIGFRAAGGGEDSVSLGTGAFANEDKSVALGSDSTTETRELAEKFAFDGSEDRDRQYQGEGVTSTNVMKQQFNTRDNIFHASNDLGQVSVGGIGNAKRQITNVQGGSDDYDAVNIAQLKNVGVVVKGNKPAATKENPDPEQTKTDFLVHSGALHIVGEEGGRITTEARHRVIKKGENGEPDVIDPNDSEVVFKFDASGFVKENLSTVNNDGKKFITNLGSIVEAADESITVTSTKDDTTGQVTYKVKSNAKGGGWNANATGNVEGTSTAKAVPSDGNVNLDAGKNLTVTQTTDADGKNQTYSFALSDEISVGAKDGAPGKDGSPGAPGKDGSIGVNGKDGSAVAINGADGSIGLNGKDGANGVSIKGQAGKVGVDGKDGETRLVYVEKDNPGKTHEIATTDDGLHFGGDIGNTASVKLNKQVDIKGGETDADKLAKGNNIGVTTEFDETTGNATLKVQLAKNIDLGNDGSVTTGNTKVDNTGVTIKAPQGGTTTDVTLTATGLNNGGNVIKNVAEGKADTDAVNVSQLNKLGNNTIQLGGDSSSVTATQTLNKAGGIKFDVVSGDAAVLKTVASGAQVAIDLTDDAKAKLNHVVKVEGKGGNVHVNPNTTKAGETVYEITVDAAQAVDPTKLADGTNTNVTGDGSATNPYKVNLNTTVDLTDAGSLKAGDTTVNNNGLTITGGPSVTKTGINAGNEKVTNVKAGDVSATSTDAVNGSQLHAVKAAERHIKPTKDGAEYTVNNNGDVTLTYVDGNGNDVADTKAVIKGIAKNDLTNITDGGKTVIQNEAKKAITLEDGKNTKASKRDNNGVDTYKVDVEGALTDITSVTGGTGTGTGKVEFAADQVVNVAGDNTIKLDGKTGDITGLTNKNLDAADFGKAGRAATEEQLKIVNESKIGDNNIKLGGDTGTTDDQALSKAGGLQFNVKGGDNGKYVSTTAAGTDVTVDLTQDTKDKIDKAANQSFNNINNDAKKVITGLGTIVKAGDNVTVDEDADPTTGQKTYTVNAKAQNLGDAELAYKANGDATTKKTVKVSDGLDFTAGEHLTASVDANGVVKYEVTLGEAPTVVNGKPGKPGEAGVNGKDGLTTVKTVVDIVNNSGWNANATGNVDGSATSTTVNPGETVNFAAGKNLTVKQEVAANGDQTYTYNLANDITIGEKGEPGTPGKDGVDGKIGVNGKDGSAVVINGKDGSIGLNGKDGKNGVSIKGQDGKVGVDGKDGETRLVYVEKVDPNDPSKDKTHEIATTDDGMKFAGDDGQENQDTNTNVISKKLNKVVDIVGGAKKDELTDNNIGVNNVDGKLKVQLAKNIDLTDTGSIKFGDNLTINNGGLTIKDGPSITKDGINAGNKVITNVTAGVADTDAVNVAQLKDVKAAERHIKPDTYAVDNDGNVTMTYLDGNGKDVANEKAVITGVAKSDLTNITDAGKKVITGLGTIVAAGSKNVTVAEDEDKTTGQKTYTVSVAEQNLGDAELKYKANGANEQSVKVSEGLNFTNGNYTTASVDANGVVKYDVNLGDAPTVKDGKAGTPGKDGNPGKDGIATIGSVVEIVNNIGWNANAGGNLAEGTTATSTTVKAGNTVNFNAGKNLTVEQTIDAANGSQTYTYALADNITAGNDGKDGKPGKDGSIGATGKDGNAVVLNGKDGTIGINGVDGRDGVNGRDGASVDLTTAQGEQTLVNRDPNKSADTDTAARIVYVPKDANGNPIKGADGKNIVREVATMDDGLIFTGNNEVRNNHKLNSVVTIIGEGVNKAKSDAFQSATGNINVKADGKGTLEIQMNKDVNLTKDGSLTIGDTIVNNDGIKNGDTTITKDGLTINNGPSVTKDGINAGNKVISGVKDGVNDDDAVNVSQLKAAKTVVANGKNTTVSGTGTAADPYKVNVEGALKDITSITNKDGNGKIEFNDNGVVNVAGNNSISLDGNKGTIGGLTNKTFDPNNFVSGQAATEDQLKALGDQVTTNVTNTLTTKGLNFKGNDGKEIHKDLGETLEIVGKGTKANTEYDATNIKTYEEDGKVVVALAKDLTANKVTVGEKGENGKDGVDGQIGVNGKDGSAVVINGKDGSIGLNGKGGANGVTIKGDQGPAGVNGKDGETKTRLIVNNEKVATLEDGMKFVGDDGNVVAKKLNETLDIVGGADKDKLTENNIGVNNDNGKLKVQLSKDIDLTDKGSIKIGDTTINNDGFKNGDTTINKDGLTITGGPSVTKNGIDAGNKVITNVGPGVKGTDAVNVDQLEQGIAAATSIEKVQTKADANNIAKVAPKAGDTFGQKGATYEVSVDKNDVKDAARDAVVVKAKEGQTVITVTPVKDDANHTTTYTVDYSGKDAAKVTNITYKANGKDEQSVTLEKGLDFTDGEHTTATVGPDGKVKIDVKLGDKPTVTDGKAGKDGKDGVATVHQVVDIVNNSGWNANATGNVDGSATSTTVKPGATVNFSAGKNMTVKQEVASNGDQTYTYNLAKDIDLGKDGSVTTGKTVVNDNGITVKNADPSKTVSVTENGLNNGGNQIKNVKAGTEDTDAVNVGQLKRSFGDVYNKMNENRKEARAGIAGANAAAGLPQAYLPGKSMVAAAAGTFKGQNALAVGYSRASDNGKVILKLQGNANSQGDVGASVGVGYQW